MDHTIFIRAVVLQMPATVISRRGKNHLIGIPMDACAVKDVKVMFIPLGNMKRAIRATPTSISLTVIKRNAVAIRFS